MKSEDFLLIVVLLISLLFLCSFTVHLYKIEDSLFVVGVGLVLWLIAALGVVILSIHVSKDD